MNPSNGSPLFFPFSSSQSSSNESSNSPSPLFTPSSNSDLFAIRQTSITSSGESSSFNRPPSSRPSGSLYHRRNKSRSACFEGRGNRQPPATSPLLCSVVISESKAQAIQELSPCLLTPKTSCLMEKVSQDFGELSFIDKVDDQSPESLRPVNPLVAEIKQEPMQVDSPCSPLVRPEPERYDEDNDYDLLCGSSQPLSPILPPVEKDDLPRSGSVISIPALHDDEEACPSPFKVPRLDRSASFSRPKEKKNPKEKEHKSKHHHHKSKSGLRSRFSSSLSSLPSVPAETPTSARPTPDLTPSLEEFREEVHLGMKLMIKNCQAEHKRLSRKSVADIISRKIPIPEGHQLLLWDARFPFEYEFGHIRGAVNFTCPSIRFEMDKVVRGARLSNMKYIVLCYCQYSSKRAPNLLDVLRCSEKDIMLEERANTATLETNEESRFTAFLVDGGFDGFYKDFAHLCDGGYLKETDDPIRGPAFRSRYEAEISEARVCRSLCKSDIAVDEDKSLGCHRLKKTRSFCFPGSHSNIKPHRMDMDCDENDDGSNVDSQETTYNFDDSIGNSDDEFAGVPLHRSASDKYL